MGVKLTGKQEGFAQAMALGKMPQNACYRANYDCDNMLPATVDVHASQLAAQEKIATRISSLRAAVTHELVKSRAWDQTRFIDEAEQNMAQARELGQMAPANGALTLIGKVTGVLTEDRVSPDTALDAIIRMAQALTDAQLRGLAEGRAQGAIEGSFELIPSEDSASAD